MPIDEMPRPAEPAPISHILETCLYVANLDRAREFYRRVLNFTTVFMDQRMCAMTVPGSAVLLLFKHGESLAGSPTPGGLIPPHGGQGVQHVCFAIPLAALDGWAARLEREGVAIESRVVQHYGGVSLYFRDPDEHSIELAVPGLWPNY
jgi:catechol 2,3-dioxygenase-like lactoylglutathione lyase family enzyme